MSTLNGYELVMAVLGDERFTHAEARFLARAVNHADKCTGNVGLSSEALGERAQVKSKTTRATAIEKAHEFGYVSSVEVRQGVVGGQARTTKDWAFSLDLPIAGDAERSLSAEVGGRGCSESPVDDPTARGYSESPGAPGNLSDPGDTGDAERPPSISLISPSAIATRDETTPGQCDDHASFLTDECPYCASPPPKSRAPEWKQQQAHETQLGREGLSAIGGAIEDRERPRVRYGRRG